MKFSLIYEAQTIDASRSGDHRLEQVRAIVIAERRRLYTAEWQRHSRQRRAEQPWCSMADATCRGTLSVDHPTDAVLCVGHHVRLEAQRRRGAAR